MKFALVALLLLLLSIPAIAVENQADEPGLEELVSLLGSVLTGALTKQQVDDPLRPTGDALYDSWAQAVQAQIDAKVYTQSGQIASILPDSSFALWEDQFGSDPRFWELRYLNALAAQNNPPTNAAGKPRPSKYTHPVDVLREADERSAVRGNTLLLIWLEAVQERGKPREDARNAWAKSHGWKPDYQLKPEERDAQRVLEQAQDALPYMDIPDTELKLLKRAIALGNDNAWSHYALGLDLIQLGRDAEGLAEIALGNAGHYMEPQAYPLPELEAANNEGRPLGNKQTSGALMLLSIEAGAPMYAQLQKQALRSYLARNPNLTPEAANTWHQYFLRKRPVSDTSIYQLVGQVTVLMIQDHVLNSWELTDDQRDALYRLRGANEEFKKTWGKSTEWDVTEATTMAVAAHGEVGMYLTGWELLTKELEAFKACSGVIAEQAQLNYTTLALPPALAKYPAIRRADRNARRLGRHLPKLIRYLIPEDAALAPWSFQPTRDPDQQFMNSLDQSGS